MKTIKSILWLFGLPFKLFWWPFGLFLNPYVKALKVALIDAIQARSGEKGKRRREAQRLATAMLSEFSRLGFTRTLHTGSGKKRKRKRQRIKFDYPLLMTADELWCPIHLPSLPTGVRTDDLRDEAVLKSLEDRLGVAVRPDYLSNQKFCFVTRLGGSTFPEVYSINKVKIDPDAPLLSVPFGIDANGDQVFADLLELKHLLIAGTTGKGKTTLNHTIINTIINRNTAEDVELRLIDMKRTEFKLYSSLLGKKGQDGIVREIAVEPEDAITVLNGTLQECDRRNRLMEQHGAVNITDLAQLTGIRLKRVVLMVDEFPQLMLNSNKYGRSSIGRVAENLMTRIASVGRSAGISIVIATQMINKDVMTGMIKANFENRLCLGTAGWRESQMVIESSDAEGLPKGRAILRIEGETRMVQTCFIPPNQVRLEISRVAQFGPEGDWGGDQELQALVKDAKLILSAACDNFQGAMSREKILALPGVRGAITQDRFNEVAARMVKDGIAEASKGKAPRQIAKGFFNRPNLLDSFYGLDSAENDKRQDANDAQTTSDSGGMSFDETVSSFPHSDAENTDIDPSAVVVCRSEDSTTPAPGDDEPQLDDLFFRAFSHREPQPTSEEPPKAATPKKPRAPRKPRAKKVHPDVTNNTEDE